MFKKFVQYALKSVGLELKKINTGKYKDLLIYESDELFNRLYDEGLKLTKTHDAGHKRRARFFNLVQLYSFVKELDGKTAECGCWKGLSSYLLCSYERLDDEYSGDLHEIYDSFSGLSKPTEDDIIEDIHVKNVVGQLGGDTGDFSAGLEKVKNNLSEFDRIEYHKGWIPQVFDSTNENKYKFVHIDVDLHEPTLRSLEYFYPKLIQGGMIVCDDYGSLRWPGAKKAIEEFCSDNIRFLVLSTGQAVLLKK